jgi:transcriptional regulator with XRE-family HTH domain
VAQRRSAENTEKLNLLGDRVRKLRMEFGISQAELCRRLQIRGWDCDVLVMSRIERGVRTLTDVEISHILKVLKRKWRDLD